MDFPLVFPFSKIEKFLSFESGGKKVFCRFAAILVVKVANIGWIKLFPKMPAVVSCQLASGVIETGDLV